MNKLLLIQKGGESVWEYIEKFHNFSLICPAGMQLPMLLQTCRHNFLDRIEVRMGVVKAYTWKKLVEQVEIAEKSAQKFEPSLPKNRGCDAVQSSQSKGKETMAVKLSGTAHPK